MYASLFSTDIGAKQALLLLASHFSPEIEQSHRSSISGKVAGHSVTFSISTLRKLIGSPHQIASEICRAGYESELSANLAIASNPDAAILLARHYKGVTLVTPGDERINLAQIPLEEIFAYDPVKLVPIMLETLLRWGVKTCEDIVALPEQGVVERLGAPGVYLRNLAAGIVKRPLRLQAETVPYETEVTLEHPLLLLEPLLFLLGRAAGDLCLRLRAQSQAARELELKLTLDFRTLDDEITPVASDNSLAVRERPALYECCLEFPVPLEDSRTILKLIQLHLERHPPGGAVCAFCLRLKPVEPRRVQGGIFLPPTPAPDKLQVTLARIAAMVGAENVGTPLLLNTHRPDAFWNSLLPEPAKPDVSANKNSKRVPEMPRLIMRLYRPALHARVHVVELTPRKVQAEGVKGKVLRSAGPWKTAGEWWKETAWSREEWDVALDDGALYRIFQESESKEWFVHGIYD